MNRMYVLGTGQAVVKHYHNTCFVLSDGEDYFLVDGGGGRRYPAVYGSDEDSVGEAAPCISDSRTHRSYSWYGMGGPLCDGADSLWKL